jgi:hypothetical protein
MEHPWELHSTSKIESWGRSKEDTGQPVKVKIFNDIKPNESYSKKKEKTIFIHFIGGMGNVNTQATCLEPTGPGH